MFFPVLMVIKQEKLMMGILLIKVVNKEVLAIITP
jgi:hypothetical protein